MHQNMPASAMVRNTVYLIFYYLRERAILLYVSRISFENDCNGAVSLYCKISLIAWGWEMILLFCHLTLVFLLYDACACLHSKS